MSGGSYCENCGYKTEKLMLVCPRCRQALSHAQCRQCGRCSDTAGRDKEEVKKVPPS